MPTLDVTRFSYEKIAALVAPGSTVLDLGCGDGELLEILERDRGCRGRGVDIEENMVIECISKGLSVFQGNLDEGLKDYPSRSYDYVILNQTLQMLQEPVFLLREMLRVGKRIIVNFPNFGHYINRFQLAVRGHMPVTRNIPYTWHDTPNIHFCTRLDFLNLCNELNMKVVDEICLGATGKPVHYLKGLRSVQVCLLLETK